MTTGRLFGFERPDAVRFAFLLAIPILAAVGGYKGWLLFQAGSVIDFAQAGLALGLSALAGILAIAFLSYWVAPRRLRALRALPGRGRSLPALSVLSRGRSRLLTTVGYGRW